MSKPDSIKRPNLDQNSGRQNASFSSQQSIVDGKLQPVDRKQSLTEMCYEFDKFDLLEAFSRQYLERFNLIKIHNIFVASV